MNCLNFNIFDLNVNENYLYPFLIMSGFMITYLGNKFIKPTLFLSGMITSSTSSYKLTEFILNEIKYDSCEIVYLSSIIMSISGGFLFLRIYSLLNFLLGFLSGGAMGYILYISLLYKYKLGVYFIYDNVFWLSTTIPGLFGGILTHYKSKDLSVFLTSFIGPILIIIPLKNIIKDNFNTRSLNDMFFFIIYISFYILFSLTGYRMQIKRDKQRNIENMNYIQSNIRL